MCLRQITEGWSETPVRSHAKRFACGHVILSSQETTPEVVQEFWRRIVIREDRSQPGDNFRDAMGLE